MHFLIHRDLRANPVIRWTLATYISALAGFLAFRPWLEAERTGVVPERYWSAIQGEPTLFILPITALDFATMVHTDLFFDSLLAIILVATLIRLPVSQRFKGVLASALLILPILVAAGGVLTFQGYGWAAYLRVFLFWSLWSCHWLVITRLLVYLFRPTKS